MFTWVSRHRTPMHSLSITLTIYQCILSLFKLCQNCLVLTQFYQCKNEMIQAISIYINSSNMEQKVIGQRKQLVCHCFPISAKSSPHHRHLCVVQKMKLCVSVPYIFLRATHVTKIRHFFPCTTTQHLLHHFKKWVINSLLEHKTH